MPVDQELASAASPSALSAALARVGDRWSFLVIDALQGADRRFGELHSMIPGLAANILAARLRRLQADGIVTASPYSRRPLRVAYRLSEEGHELGSALRLLAAWGARGTRHAEPARHEACGTPLEVRWYCPTCERLVPDGESDLVRL